MSALVWGWTRRHPVLAGCICAWAAAATAAPDATGRWQGVAQIPGAPQPVVVDLARSGSAWRGSITLPGRGVKGAPLKALQVGDDGVTAATGAAFPFPIEPSPGLALRWRDDGRLAGVWRQGGHEAPLEMARSGDAQPDAEPQGTPLAAALLGTWTGRYELGGVPREVTLTLANGADGKGRGALHIVGKRTSDLVVDHVVQGREFITLLASEYGYRIEGRYDAAAGRIDGGVVQGPFEATLVLRRQAGG